MSRRVILWACTADGLQSTVQDVNDLYACAAVEDGIVPLHLPLWNSHPSVAETWDVSRAQVVDNSTHEARNVRESFIQVSTLRPHNEMATACKGGTTDSPPKLCHGPQSRWEHQTVIAVGRTVSVAAWWALPVRSYSRDTFGP